MKFFIKVKQIGKRRALIERRAYEVEALPDNTTLRDFLAAIVRAEVLNYNNKSIEKPIIPFLTTTAIDDQHAAGKVGFGAIYHPEKAVLEKAIATTLLAFEDGLFAVFLDDEAITTLDTPLLQLTEDSTLIFIQLALLRG
jgi:hypothetical protein